MTEFSPSELPRLSEAEAPRYGISDNKVEARSSDWLFGLLIVLALLAFLLALMVGLLQFLSSIAPTVGWLQSVTSTVNNPILPAALLPAGMPVGFLITVLLLVLSGLLFLGARRRILHNPSMQAEAGCPTCQEQDLVRVHRKKRDRMISSLGIPFARYQCRECTWNGLRVKQETQPPIYVKEYLAAPISDEAVPEEAVPDEAVAEVAAAPDEAGTEETKGDLIHVSAQDFENVVAPARSENTAAVYSLTLEGSAENGPGFTGSTSEAAPQTDLFIDYREPGQGQEWINDPDYAKIVSPLGLNLRKEPQPDGEVIGMLAPGTVVMLLEQSKQVDGITWREIRANDQDGWVLDAFLELYA